jgi:hypothetical protein
VKRKVIIFTMKKMPVFIVSIAIYCNIFILSSPSLFLLTSPLSSPLR